MKIDYATFNYHGRIGIESKRVDVPRLTPSVQIALTDLQLDRVVIVYPGDKSYPLADRVTAVPLSAIVLQAEKLLWG
ncbi:MAG: hypothetical protein ABI847_10925 [Anaerolineales bacterium]